ncbi:hypothetical protein OSB04_027026 [Centaurea solstitialis]|uniref:AAA+ ATPase domain-containing protein n=1 Tax=Centaurea solstitialis TaxID=347529 RepID=A0AA38SQI6_9ASTR|nr:hypothetical protein OSB04_027026 [Centaurea solstitialis]
MGNTALHPAQTVNNIKTHIPLTLDLKKVQYETWAELFQVVARAHSVIDHLDDRPPDVPTPTPQWTKIDAVVLTWIYGTVSEDLLLTIIKPGSTARDAWLRVKNASLENHHQKRKSDASPNSTVSKQSDGTNRDTTSTNKCIDMLRGPDGELPAKLRSVESYLIERISNEIMSHDPNVRWEDIAGLHHAKKCVTEMVIWPLLRPDIFKGCRSPGRGLLLFGPPGTGKTMIGKAIAGEAKATFFYISASSVLGKWMGEGEKLVRALFGLASCRQPAVIFVDEIDSLLSRRSDREHDVTRRIKTQFLIEMEGCDTGSEQILLIGATNRPQDLDEAARRRLTKRLYIPLPSSGNHLFGCKEARAWIVRNLLEKDGLFKLSTEDIDSICKSTEGYSGSDMKNLVKDASMGPLREAFTQGTEITNLKKEDMRDVNLQDFENALQEVRPSVFLNELGSYEDWNSKFGSFPSSTMQPRRD